LSRPPELSLLSEPLHAKQELGKRMTDKKREKSGKTVEIGEGKV